MLLSRRKVTSGSKEWDFARGEAREAERVARVKIIDGTMSERGGRIKAVASFGITGLEWATLHQKQLKVNKTAVHHRACAL